MGKLRLVNTFTLSMHHKLKFFQVNKTISKSGQSNLTSELSSLASSVTALISSSKKPKSSDEQTDFIPLIYTNESFLWTTQPYIPIPATDNDYFSLTKMIAEFKFIILPGIVVSLLVIVASMIMCEIAYRLIIHNVIPGLFKSVILDFISAGEACIISWELITIFHQYGEPIWAVLAFMCMIIKTYRFKIDCASCPYNHLLALLKGYISTKDACIRIIFQFLGGSVFFRWQSYVWDFGLTPIHIGRAYWTAYGRCTAWLADLTWVGFLYEFTGSLLCNIAATIIFDFELFPKVSVHWRIFASSGITMSLVIVCFHHTGGFFQPLLAFARTFGCIGVLRDVTVLDHIVVYWVGATLGAVLAMYTSPYVKKLIMALTWRHRGHKSVKVKGIEEALPLVEDHAHNI